MSAPLWVIGLAAWGDDASAGLDAAARSALGEANVVVGGQRNLETVAALLGAHAQTLTLSADLAALDDVVGASAPTAVVASGDPGFFGVLRALRARLDPDAAAHRLRVRPAVSSVAAVFAHAGLPWDDAVVVSAHGRDAATAIAVARRHPKVAVLTSPGFGPGDLADAVDDRPRRWIVAEQLGTPAQHVTESWPQLDARDFDEPNVVALVAADAAHGDAPGAVRGGEPAPPVLRPPRPGQPGWARPDDAFAHRDGQITKAEVRAQALAWLGPGIGDLVWDVGCGSGSVGVECAALGAAVVALDRDADQRERTGANAHTHGVPVDVRAGQAPAALADLPDPDAVFVGGGGAEVAAIAAAAADRARRVVVVALAALERVAPVWAALAAAGCHVDAVQLAASRLVALPGADEDQAAHANANAPVHRLSALNPVTLVRGVRP